MRFLGSILFCTTVLAALPAAAASDVEVQAEIEQILGDAPSLDEPMLSIRESIETHDPESLAEFTEFPLGNSGEDVDDADELGARFDELFTEEVKAALAATQYSDLIVNTEGVGLGNGAIWINKFCDDDACTKSHWALARVNN